MSTPVKLALTLTEAEALAHFLAVREELWTAEARDFGVAEPIRIGAQLAAGYRAAIAADIPLSKTKPPRRCPTKLRS